MTVTVINTHCRTLHEVWLPTLVYEHSLHYCSLSTATRLGSVHTVSDDVPQVVRSAGSSYVGAAGAKTDTKSKQATRVVNILSSVESTVLFL